MDESMQAIVFSLSVGLILALCWLLNKLGYFRPSWKNVPKDTVVVHCAPPMDNIVCGSPYGLKVQTYLRMAGIPYKVREVKSFETDYCYIYMNDELIKKMVIIEFLRRKFKNNLNQPYSPDELAIARSVRVMLEARWFCRRSSFWDSFTTRHFHGLQFDNSCFNYTNFDEPFGLPNPCSKESIIKTVEGDLKVLSKILGEKLFILGDEPCEDDATIFGYLAQAVWIDTKSDTDSPYEELLNGELLNLKSYCVRMKEKFWPDWDQCLRKSTALD